MTMVEIIIGSLIAVVIFVIGVIVGLYINQRPKAGGRHRQPARTVPPQRIRLDDRRHLSQEGLDEFRRDFRESMESHDSSRMDLLRDYVDETVNGSPDEEGDKLPPEEPVSDLREYYDTHSTAKSMKEGHWEGLSGSLEPEPKPVVLRPEETSSSLLGLSEGAIKPTAKLKPVFGETERLEYDPEDYEEPLICQPCTRPLAKGETFWAVSLPEEGDGVFIPICDECEAKSHG